MTSAIKKIELALLGLDYQTRAATDTATAQEYAELPADTFPPVVVYSIGGAYQLADGFHRVLAAQLRGDKRIKAEVREGTIEDAILYGGTANNKQGKRPTREDTQHFMRMVWERRDTIFGGTPTGGNLAERCGVSVRMASDFVRCKLAEMESETAAARRQNAEVNTPPTKAPMRPAKLIGADGKMYPVRPVRPVVQQPTEAPAATVRPLPPVIPTATQAKPTRPVYRDNAGVEHCVPLDRYGHEIPVPLQGAFDPDNADKLAQVLHHISEARCTVARELERGNPVFGAVRQEMRLELDNAYNYAKAAQVHCVCRMCHGQGCNACGGRGWQTEEQYGRNPEEFKAEGVQS